MSSKNNQKDDDDLMAMLEESQKDFVESKEETKNSEPSVIDELKEANNKDNKKSEEKVENNPENMQEDFFKGFEQLAKNLSGMNPDEMNLKEEDLNEATKMFQQMFKIDDGKEGDKGEDKEPEDPTLNPFVAGYKNMQKDAKSMNENKMPGMGDINNMFQDEEFKDFFTNFTQGIFNNQGEGFDPSKMFEGAGGNPEEMMEKLMKEMGGYLDENKDDPEVKNTIEEMMSSLVSKDSIFPSLKIMKENFPDYLEKHADTLEVKELERYNNQLDCIEEICAIYEMDEKPEKEKVIDCLFKLQQYGAPPDELVEKLKGSAGASFPGFPGMGGLPGLGGFPS